MTERPLGGYAALSGTFATLVVAFGTWIRRSGRELPERMDPGDLVLVSIATHKLARLITKERVTSTLRAPFTSYQGRGGPGEVEERARGRGLRRAIGELLTCPYCISLWIAAGFAAGLTVAPRATRWIAAIFTAVFGSDALQLAYKRLEQGLDGDDAVASGSPRDGHLAKLADASPIG